MLPNVMVILQNEMFLLCHPRGKQVWLLKGPLKYDEWIQMLSNIFPYFFKNKFIFVTESIFYKFYIKWNVFIMSSTRKTSNVELFKRCGLCYLWTKMIVGFLRESIHCILTALLRAKQIFKTKLNQCITINIFLR
jgi:hypothetical protein